MTKAELIAALEPFPSDMNIYVPSDNGKIDIVKSVGQLVHVNCPEGVSIPDDIYLSPWGEQELEERCAAQQ